MDKVIKNCIAVYKRHGKCSCSFCDIFEECFGGVTNLEDYVEDHLKELK